MSKDERERVRDNLGVEGFSKDNFSLAEVCVRQRGRKSACARVRALSRYVGSWGFPKDGFKVAEVCVCE